MITPATLLMVEHLKDLSSQGMSHDDAAAAIGAPRAYLVSFAARHRITFGRTPSSKRVVSAVGLDARSRRMAELFKSGSTLQEIGTEYGVTRERVRQILWSKHGIRGRDGGQSVVAALGKAARLNAREARYQRRYGCSRAQYREVLAAGGTRAYTELQRNTNRDGIKLELTLFQWWGVWQASGHWNDRGRGRHGFWLFRLRADAPLSLDNYCIAPGGDAMRFMRQVDPQRFARIRPDASVPA